MRFHPLGGSMAPFLRPGDEVLVLPDQRCWLGDVVLCLYGETLVLHRVVAKIPGGIITKGDSLRCTDQATSYGNLLGRAVSRTRRGRVKSLESSRSRMLGMAFSLMLSWFLPCLRYMRYMHRRTRSREGQAA
jgi:hypothetical protein